MMPLLHTHTKHTHEQNTHIKHRPMWNRRAKNTFTSETHKWNTHVKHSHLHCLLGSFALLISGTYGLPFAYHMFVLYYIHSIYTYSHAAYHAMSSAGPRRSMFRAIVWLVPFAKLMHHIEVVYILIYNVYNTALNIIWAHMIQNRCHTLCNKATSCIAFIYICMCTYLLICALYTCRPDLGRMTGCRLWNASW